MSSFFVSGRLYVVRPRAGCCRIVGVGGLDRLLVPGPSCSGWHEPTLLSQRSSQRYVSSGAPGMDLATVWSASASFSGPLSKPNRQARSHRGMWKLVVEGQISSAERFEKEYRISSCNIVACRPYLGQWRGVAWLQAPLL